MHSSFVVQALGTAFLASLASGHMIMKTPVPFSVDKLDNGPLVSEAQFPCKRHLGFNVSTQNTMAVGEEQTLSFTGSAVHGGGSCQLAITADKVPTENSKFKVIKSIQGGCPGRDGGPAEFKFTLPKETPNGDITFAWTWFAKMSGAPEMYMNCAPVTVTGGSDGPSAMESLPDIFKANIIENCKTALSQVAQFPNPGANLEDNLLGEVATPPIGACAQDSAASPPGGGSAPPVPEPTSAIGGNNGQPAAPPSPPVNTGVVLAPGASSNAPGQPTATLTTLVTVTGGVPGQTSAVVPPAPSTPPSTPSGTPVAPPDTPSAPPSPPTTPANPPAAPPTAPTAAPPAAPPADGGATTCTTDGAVVCNGADQFGLCNHGSVIFQPVAAGTTCSNGAITRKKRSFPRAHKRHFHGVEHRY